jgi:hypothetical protein
MAKYFEFIALAAGFCFILIGLAGWLRLRRLEGRLTRALGGAKNAARLEKVLAAYFAKLNATEEVLRSINNHYEQLQAVGAASYQKMGLVRFNPFRDTGGDQSFALCLLNNHDSGIMITAVHGRDGTRLYAKSVEGGKSTASLSAEEERALASAVTPRSGARRRPHSR